MELGKPLPFIDHLLPYGKGGNTDLGSTFFMATIRRFEDLEVWQFARKLSRRVYLLTFEGPISKDYRLRDQIRGSAGSVMDNIAEGFGRSSRLEFIHARSTAKGEAAEMQSQLHRAMDNGYLDQKKFDELYELADHIAGKLAIFISYLNQTHWKGQKFKNRSPDVRTPNAKQHAPNSKLQTPNPER
ncbi:MAG TPA: four helix bundle protein [Chitinophagaceae bacterium]|nr:four helix bundle protein [Chitinophagaceae bacterium]